MYKKVLVALDGSPFAEAILKPVEQLVQGTDTVVVLVGLTRSADALDSLSQGATPPTVPFGFAVYPSNAVQGVESHTIETVDQAYVRIKDELLGYLSGPAEHLKNLGIGVEMGVAIGEPADALIHYCQQIGADLIATATHARSGVAHLLHPGVAEKVVHSGAAPVLLVRSDAPSDN